MPAAVGVAELSAAGPAPLRSPPGVALKKNPSFPLPPCLGFDLLIIWSRRKEGMDNKCAGFRKEASARIKGSHGGGSLNPLKTSFYYSGFLSLL